MNIKIKIILAAISFILIVSTIYLISPTTHLEDTGHDYSDRYYELLKKNPLTEEERNEMILERKHTEEFVLKKHNYDSKN